MTTELRNKVENGALDATDLRILALLQDNAKMPQAEMAREVGLTAPSVNERIKKLERSGYIRGYVTLLDGRKLGQDVTAFVEVFIEHPKHEAFVKQQSLEAFPAEHVIPGHGSVFDPALVDRSAATVDAKRASL